MAPNGLGNSFLAAIQASLSVLLVIFYGGVAAHLNLLNPSNTKAISKVCVRMFLPALLIVKIGSELHAESAGRYLIIFVWAIICHLVSFVIGIVAHLWLGMPDWTTVALMFNNTTSYPLLLIGALDETGILRSLIVTDESTREAVERAKSYFLVFATVSSCLTFAVGPRLIDSEHAPEESKEECAGEEGFDEHEHEYGHEPAEEPFDAIEARYDDAHSPFDESNHHERTALLSSGRPSTISIAGSFGDNSFFPSRRRLSTVTPRRSYTNMSLHRRASIVPRQKWYRLGPRAQWWLLFISDFFNAPLLGALLGAVIGLIPALHRAFFNDTYEGGIFSAWLTASLKSIGGLFVPLPVVVAGVSLYTAMKQARSSSSGSSGASLPWITVTFILVVRFVLWPLASIFLVYGIVKSGSGNLLGDDPMLWFAMMLMPTGPPAMKLITLVQVSDADEEDETNIAKLLTVRFPPILE